MRDYLLARNQGNAVIRNYSLARNQGNAVIASASEATQVLLFIDKKHNIKMTRKKL